MVKYRNPVLVIVFSIITLGIYGVYWLVSTTNELRRLTSTAPNPWSLLLLLVPVVGFFVAIWYYWKYSAAIGEISNFESWLLFILWILVSPAAMVIAQIELNKKAQASV
jgi:cytochrome bd-type quinol oxidase subunit 2